VLPTFPEFEDIKRPGSCFSVRIALRISKETLFSFMFTRALDEALGFFFFFK